MNRIIPIFVVVFILVFAQIVHASPKVFINGQPLSFEKEAQPTIENSRTLVPLRAIFEALGAEVQWDDKTKTVSSKKGNSEIKLVINGQAFINGQPVNLDVPAKIVEGRTLDIKN